MARDTLIDASRVRWSTTTERANLNDIEAGCLQRIADAQERQAAAAENLAKDRQKMEGEIRYLRSRDGELTKTAERLERTNAALRGSRYTAGEVRKAVAELFLEVGGKIRATRLVIENPGKRLNGGGWCEKAAQDHVENVLKINRLPRKKGSKR